MKLTLNSPIIITPRLLPGIKIGNDFVSIQYSDKPGNEGRTRYQWFVDIGDQEYSDDDLQSGCQGGSLQEGLESLLSFLSSAGESYAYEMRTGQESDNSDLFDAALTEWCYQNSDELTMAGIELEESENLICEN